TIPTNGTLTLNGVAVTAGQSIAVADINSNLLVFTPAADANGAGYDNFTFQVQDDGGTANGGVDTDQTPNTITIDVNAVNDEPAGADNTVTTNEDTGYTFAAADFGFSDAVEGDSLQAVTITTIPTNGTLTLNGVAVTAGQSIAVADINSNLLVFTPAANANGASYDSFTFQVQDDGGTANGGVDTDQTPNTITIDVNAVNDEPAGADNTVTTNEDAAYTFSTADFGFSDTVEGDSLQAVVITTIPTTGTLTLNGVAVTAGQSVSAADIASNLLVFTPVANENGASYDAFTFQVQDDGGTANGGVDLDQTPNTMTIDVTSVNDAPEGADNTLSVVENNSHTFSAADFGFTDPNDTPADTFFSVIVSTLPANGSLELSGVAVTIGQEIAVGQLGNLVYTPPINANGTGYASFDFQVKDNGGTANGGVDTDQSAKTITFDVVSVNDAPTGADNTVTTLEDAAYTFAAADFGFADAADTPANNFLNVIITSLPTAGTLELSGVAVTAGQVIAVGDIPNLVFTPDADANGAGYSSFTFQVQDDDGTNFGGQDTDQSANTITFDVTSVNDEPDGTDNTVTTNEDTPYTFAAGDFGFTDPNDNPDNNLLNVIITTIPTNGTLTLNGVAVTAGQVVSVADINSNLLVFTPALNDNGAGYDSFTFQVQDDDGTANGGQDTDQSANTMTIDVTAIDDPPVLNTNAGMNTFEGFTETLTTAMLSSSDVDTAASDIVYTITSNVANGQLELTTNAGVAITSFTQDDLDNNRVVYVHDSSETTTDSFDFEISDATTNIGSATFNISITPVNDEPIGADNTVTTLEDAPYTFSTADFGFTDPNDTPSNNLQNVIITTIPSNGALTLNGVAVTAGQAVSAADIASNLLVFTPVANANGAGYDSFTFQVQDDGGTANTGVDTDQSANTMTIDVTSVNDAQDGADITLTTLEDTTLTFTAADFGFSDVNDSPANALQSIVFTTVPATGSLQLSGVAVTAGQEIAVADIPNLTYDPVADENGAAYTSFTFQVRDDGGTSDGGVNLDPVANTVTIDVTSVNDEPAGADNTVTTLEDTDYTFTAAEFGFTDPNDLPANSLAGIVITTVPASGSLSLAAGASAPGAVTAGQVVSAADIAFLTYSPALNDNGLAADSFTFQVQDDDGTANGGQDTDQSANTMTIDITSVNDAPDGADDTILILESSTYTFAAADFGFTDAAELAANNLYSVIIDTLPANGALELSGVAVTAGQEILVADIPNLTFAPVTDENGVGYASIDFRVRDDGGTANGGVDTDVAANTITFDVDPINSAPIGADNTITILEDSVLTFAAADFGFTDPNDIPSNSLQGVIINTLPVDGVLELSGVAVTAGQTIAVADIPNLTFTPANHEYGAGYASFDFQVQDDGGVANGGVDIDPAPNTITIDVTEVNDEPAGADITLTTLEDTTLTFTAANFGFTDVNDSPSDNLQSIIITTLPADGVLQLSGVNVTAGQEIAVADIPNLTFDPATDENGAGYTSFTFQVRDDGGTADGGVDTDQSPNVVTIDVTSVNDAPDGTDNTVTTLEDTDYIFTTADFGFTDPNDDPDNNLLNVIIDTLPVSGTLTLAAGASAPGAVTAGQVISAADIAFLTFTPVADENGAAYASFDFRVQDDDGTANGGADTDPVANTMTIDVTSVNDEPAGADITLTTLEDTAYTFAAGDFGFTDPNDT
ncbi:MAG: cadherin-like domain-containing protein, partial [Pseudomonadota bacterium]|nr:cadherin-like domain-containing protein [Pseudomonadota bacterium]